MAWDCCSCAPEAVDGCKVLQWLQWLDCWLGKCVAHTGRLAKGLRFLLVNA